MFQKFVERNIRKCKDCYVVDFIVVPESNCAMGMIEYYNNIITVVGLWNMGASGKLMIKSLAMSFDTASSAVGCFMRHSKCNCLEAPHP